MASPSSMACFCGVAPVLRGGAARGGVCDAGGGARAWVRMGRRGGGRGGARGAVRRGDGRRPHRVGELIRREMAGIVDGAFAAQPGSALVSVVDVRCSDDLRNARVSVSVLGSDDERTLALAWLREHRRELRFELARGMRGMKSVPELSFAESEVAQAVNTVTLIDRLQREREEKEARGGVVVQVPAEEGGLDMDALAEDPFLEEDEHVVAGLQRLDDDELDDAADDHIVELDAEDGDAKDYNDMSDDGVIKSLYKTRR